MRLFFVYSAFSASTHLQIMSKHAEAHCAIFLPGFNSLSYVMPHSHIKVHLTAGITNVFDGEIADYILSHPMTELYESIGLIEIKDSTSGTDDTVFEVTDSKTGDSLPVGDLAAPEVGKAKTQTKYRGRAGKSKEAAEAIVKEHKVEAPQDADA